MDDIALEGDAPSRQHPGDIHGGDVVDWISATPLEFQ